MAQWVLAGAESSFIVEYTGGSRECGIGLYSLEREMLMILLLRFSWAGWFVEAQFCNQCGRSSLKSFGKLSVHPSVQSTIDHLLYETVF